MPREDEYDGSQTDETSVSEGTAGDDEQIEHSNGTEERIRRLEEAQGSNQAREVLNRLLADPDVSAVIRAKNSGKQVKISDAEPEATPEEPEEPAELRELPEDDPQRKLVGTVLKLMDAKLAKVLSPLSEQLANVQNVADAVQRKDVTDAVASARQKYKDFDQFRDQILELSKTHEGLKVEDYYILAKHRAGKLRQVETVTQSEKPSSLPRRVGKPGTAPAAQKRPQGRAGFQEILRDAFGRINFEDQ